MNAKLIKELKEIETEWRDIAVAWNEIEQSLDKNC
jgi:hypothetical protein